MERLTMNGVQMGFNSSLFSLKRGGAKPLHFGQSDDSSSAKPASSAPAATPAEATEAPPTDYWVNLANTLIADAGEAPLAPQVPLFTPAEGKQMIAEGKIEQFNERLEHWRKYQAKPDEYFDLKGFPFGATLKNLEALSAIDPEVNASETLDLRGCDLREADFRGLKTLSALLTHDDTDPDSQEKHIKSALFDSSTQFSLSTVKICT
jgi:hypothetical protein